jgi:hypothetical protein
VWSKRKVVSSRMASKRGESGRREKRHLPDHSRSLAGRSAIAAPAIAALLWLAAPAAPAQDTKAQSLRTHAERGLRFLPSRKNCIPMPVGAATCARPVPGPIRRSPATRRSKPWVSVRVDGQHGMPPVGGMMSDEQVTTVVNCVRAHFGSHCWNAVTADKVKVVCSADTWSAIRRRRP